MCVKWALAKKAQGQDLKIKEWRRSHSAHSMPGREWGTGLFVYR